MNSRLRLLACVTGLVLLSGVNRAIAADAPAVRLWRLDCGQIRVDDLNDFSDTWAYGGKSMRLIASCYLIQHGSSYLLWDTGLPESDLGNPLDGPGAKEESLGVTLTAQLKTLGLTASQITDIGISHYHYDHTGQAQDFPAARLLLGKGDVEALRQPGNPRAKPLAHWISGDGKLDAVEGDRDVYSDGTVVMLNLPGHTPGHHGLLLKLAHTGYVLLSGDVAHFHENYESNGLPAWNTDRAQSLASMERVRGIIAHTGAAFIIQHDPRDVAKLPAFPKAAD